LFDQKAAPQDWQLVADEQEEQPAAQAVQVNVEVLQKSPLMQSADEEQEDPVVHAWLLEPAQGEH